MKATYQSNGLAIPNSPDLRLSPDAGPSESVNNSLVTLSQVQDLSSYESVEDDLLGLYFRPDAPFRAKISVPHEPGMVLVIRGRVWAYDTKEPLARAKMDIWQANAQGKYDQQQQNYVSSGEMFRNRARLYCDETGYYEFETIHPGPYRISGEVWRAPHINFRVRYPGYAPLVTQLFFTGDPYHDVDPLLIQSLVISLQKKESNGMNYEEGVFDIVLLPADV
jgi:catechol 1,2-dioxygenase